MVTLNFGFYILLEAAEDEGVERSFTDRPVTTQVLPHEKLVGVIHKQIIDNYSDNIELNYGYEVYPEEFEAKNNNVYFTTATN